MEKKLRKYIVSYDIKHDCVSDHFICEVEAANAEEARKKVLVDVKASTGRHAFHLDAKVVK